MCKKNFASQNFWYGFLDVQKKFRFAKFLVWFFRCAKKNKTHDFLLLKNFVAQNFYSVKFTLSKILRSEIFTK